MERKFIINPGAARGKFQQEFEKIKNFFESRLDNFDYVFTKNREDIVTQTRLALKEGSQQIIAVGGDGTINNVVNGFYENEKIINPDACLAIGASGTGSDFFKTVTYQKDNRDWKEIVLDHQIEKVDIGLVHFLKDKWPDRYFINVAGHGISAVVTRIKDELPKWTPSSLTYLVATLKAIKEYKPILAQIKLDGEEFEAELLGLFVCKGMFAGGGMRFANYVEKNDGRFEVLLVSKLGILNTLKKLPYMYKENKDELFGRDGIEKRFVSSIELRSKESISVELDGENSGTTDLKIELIESGINICFPVK